MADSRMMALVCLLAIGASTTAAAEVVLSPAELDRVTAGVDQCTNCEPPPLPDAFSQIQARYLLARAAQEERVAELLATRNPRFAEHARIIEIIARQFWQQAPF